MIFSGMRSSHSADVVVREHSPSHLDVFFSVVGRRCEGCNYHFILLPDHLFNITMVGKVSFLCFSYDLSHHTPHPFVPNLQLICLIGYMLVPFFLFLSLTHYQ